MTIGSEATPATPLWKPVLIGAGCATFVGMAGGLVTDIGPWYQQLNKPAWVPPPWAFGAIWTTIFCLATIAGVRAWRRLKGDGRRKARLYAVFAANAALNIFWSLLFFRLHRPDWALFEVVALWVSITILMAFLVRISKLSTLLILPYLVWVSIAAELNATILHLNGPFG